jgi:viologen exporter family transport system permease protein
MRAYRAVLSARFRMLLQYRAAAVAGFATQLFWGLIRVMVFEAFYRSSSAPQPMRFDQVVTYVWLGQAMLLLHPTGWDPDVRTMIRTGTVAYEMLRPVDLYNLWYSRDLAARLAPTLLRAVPLFVLAGLFFGLQAPPSWASAGAWAATTLGALLLSSAISTLLTISLLWTISGEGIARLAPMVIYAFSGMLVPLPLLPDWARGVVNVLPFRGLADLPFRVYMGHIPPAQLGPVLAHQLGWAAALVLLGRGVLALGTRRLVIQGG